MKTKKVSRLIEYKVPLDVGALQINCPTYFL